MKCLLFSDLHSDRRKATELVERSRTVDVAVCAGDLCNAHQQLERMIEILSRISVPVIVVAGNNETTSELHDACTDLPNWHVLHGNSVVVADTTFWGVGGGIPVTPFGAWSYDFAEDQAVPLLTGCPQGGVLVTHSPPHGVLDLSSIGSHLGSLAIRSTIERVRPKLAVCGHIHASGGRQAQLGDTVVINAGPNGVIWGSP